MDEDQLFLRPADPPAERSRPESGLKFCLGQAKKGGPDVDVYLYAIQNDLELMRPQLARLPTRNEVWRAAMLGMLGGAVAAVTLIDGILAALPIGPG